MIRGDTGKTLIASLEAKNTNIIEQCQESFSVCPNYNQYLEHKQKHKFC